MTRQRAYLLPETLCPAERLDICVSIPNDLGHIMPFLAQLEHLANWYAWETNLDRDNDVVAACWRDVFNAVRHSIDESLGCGTLDGIQDIRLIDCILEKQDATGAWTTVGSIADCVISGIDDALSNGTIPASPYPMFPPPEVNTTNDTTAKMACGIADFIATYLIEKFNDQLDLIEAEIGASVAVGKIALDVADAVAGWAPIVGGVIAAVKDVIEGSVSVTFAVIRASDTVDWRTDAKCDLYNRLLDNDGAFGETLAPVVTGWISFLKSRSEAISPLFGRFLEGLDIRGFQKWQKIAENNQGECDDCTVTWCYQYLSGLGIHPAIPLTLVTNFGNQAVYDATNDLVYCPDPTDDRFYRTIEAHLDLSAYSGFTVESIDIDVHKENFGQSGQSGLRDQIVVDGVEKAWRTQAGDFVGTDDFTLTAGSLALDSPNDIKIYLESAKSPPSDHTKGVLQLLKVTVRGTGTSPFSSDNCE